MIGLKELKAKYRTPRDDENRFGFIVRLIHINLSLPLAWLGIVLRMNPNLFTALWVLMGIVSALLLSSADYVVGILAALLLNLAFTIDQVDGTVARYQKKHSPFGMYLDQTGHLIVDSLLMASIAVHAYFRFDNFLFIVLGFAAVISVLFYPLMSLQKIHSYLHDKKRPNPNSTKKTNQVSAPILIKKAHLIVLKLFRLDFYILILVVLTLFDHLYLFILFYGIAYPLYTLAFYGYELKRGYGWVDDIMANQKK